MRAGLVQLTVGDDPAANLPDTVALVRQAVDAGAEFVLTPECTNALSSNRDRQRALFRHEEDDLTLAALRLRRPAAASGC
jgi:deaminated glutathione amidase